MEYRLHCIAYHSLYHRFVFIMRYLFFLVRIAFLLFTVIHVYPMYWQAVAK